MGDMKPINADEGWAWVVLAGSFMLTILFGGMILSFGVFYMAFLDEFQQGPTTTSWLGSVLGGMSLIPGPLVSMLANRYGCRIVTVSGVIVSSMGFLLSGLAPNIWVMIITYGIMGGYGLCCILVCSGTILPFYFVKRRCLATGIMLSGIDAGGVVFPIVVQCLLQHLQWNHVIMFLAAIVLTSSILGVTFRPISSPKSVDDGHIERKIMDFSICKSPAIMILYTGAFINRFIGYYMPFFYLPAYAIHIGLTTKEGALLLSIAGAASFAGRIISGCISDVSWANPPMICGTLLIVGGVSTMGAPLLTSFPLLSVYAIIFGFSYGTYMSLSAVVLVGLVGKDKMSNAFGFLAMFRGLAVLAGTPLAGFLISTLGGHLPVFIIAGVSIALSGVMFFPLRYLSQCLTKPQTVGDNSVETQAYSITNICAQNKNPSQCGDIKSNNIWSISSGICQPISNKHADHLSKGSNI